MRVYLDELPLMPDQPTLACALQVGREAAERSRRVIVEVKVDGRPVDGSLLDSPSLAPMRGAEVRLVTAEPRSLVRTTYLDVADLLPKARQLLGEAARRIQGGDFQRAFEELSEALTVWDTVRQVVEQGPALLGMKPEGVQVRDGTLASHIAELSGQLVATRDALSTQDWSTLADCLEGDLDASAQRWEAMLRGMAEQLAGRADERGEP